MANSEWSVYGMRMRSARELFRISLRDLGKEMGLSPAQLSDLELGRAEPTIEIRDKYWKSLKAVAIARQRESNP